MCIRDRFWGLRGGGGNFGVVTKFTFRLHPVPALMAGFVMYPIAAARDVLAHYEERTRLAPDELSLVAALVAAPPAPFVPKELQFQPVVAVAACYVGDARDGAEAVQPVRGFGRPAVDTFAVQPYTQVQQWFDGGVPHGLHYHCRSEWLKPLDGAAIDALVKAGGGRSSPLSQVLLRHMGGATARVAPDATAFRFRHATHILTLASCWEPGDGRRDLHRQWCHDAWTSLRPASAGGTYVNHLSDDEGEARTREAYGAATWERLVAVKRRYDPGNLFRMNQNIDPKG